MFRIKIWVDLENKKRNRKEVYFLIFSKIKFELIVNSLND